MLLKEILWAIVIALGLIAGAIILRPSAHAPFELMGYDGVMYRLNQNSGRIDVLVPTSEGALMMPIGQISSPVKEKMSAEEKKQFSSFIKTVAQYLQIERAKTLGLKIVPAENSASAGSEITPATT